MIYPDFYEPYASKIQDELPKKLSDISQLMDVIVEIINAGGYPYLVGGAARDIIHSSYFYREFVLPTDLDIEVFGITQDKLEEILDLQLTGNNFPVYNTTYNVQYYDGLNQESFFRSYDVQFSLPRRERKVAVGHNGFEIDVDPDMSPYDASQRRDLTINSIMINLRNYCIYDYNNGINDLLLLKKAHYVNEDTFIEDPLRVLRTARFLTKYDLSATSGLVAACSNMVSEFPFLTSELREKEITKIFEYRRFYRAFDFLQDVGWLKHIYPRYSDFRYLATSIASWNFMGTFEFARVNEVPFNMRATFFAIMLNRMTTADINEWFKRINPNWDRTLVKQVCNIVRVGNDAIDNDSCFLDSNVLYRYLQYNIPNMVLETALYISILTNRDFVAEIYTHNEYFLNNESFPIINGNDCLEYMEQGKNVGIVLQFFANNHIQGIITDREMALKMLPNVISLVERGINV